MSKQDPTGGELAPEEGELLSRAHGSETVRHRRRAQQQSLADLHDPAQAERIDAIRKHVHRRGQDTS